MAGGLLLLAALFGAGVMAHAQPATDPQNTATARAIETRLLAPCCWVQTLDVHDSEIAQALRAEIEQRVARGESGEAIEDELAARYGERIRAVPRGSDPFGDMAVAVYVVMAAALALLLVVARRRVRRTRSESEPEPTEPASSPELDRYRARVDEELERLAEL